MDSDFKSYVIHSNICLQGIIVILQLYKQIQEAVDPDDLYF